MQLSFRQCKESELKERLVNSLDEKGKEVPSDSHVH